MTRPAARREVEPPPLRGVCVVVKGKHSRRAGLEPARAASTVAQFPRRPDPGTLSETIPLFFVGRNRNGLWIAREALGRTGGIFLFKRSALRFAQKSCGPVGCATMVLTERLELDVENEGNPFAAWLGAALGWAAELIPDYPPSIPLGRRIFEGERR